MAEQVKFAVIRRPRRIWAVASVHAEAQRLENLHSQLAGRIQRGDRLVYLGNIIGYGPQAHEAIDNLLAFRRAFIAGRGMFAGDVALLRGAQEEMLEKLLQLHFALQPVEILEWMLEHGLASTLASYGSDAADGFRAARSGASALARWTGALRDVMHSIPGHLSYLSALRRAAYTVGSGQPKELLFVNSGIDPGAPLDDQTDSFWWDFAGFSRITAAYGDFGKVIRGHDPARPGAQVGDFTLTLDAGCGFGGPLIAACLSSAGDILDLVEA